jgi:hypothetical protein
MEALMQAAEAQAQAMAQSRAAGLQPGQKPVDNGQPAPGGSGNMLPQELVQAGDPPKLGDLPDLKRMSAEDWAKLPPKVAEQLLESQREAMSPEFRQQINNYFRIIGGTRPPQCRAAGTEEMSAAFLNRRQWLLGMGRLTGLCLDWSGCASEERSRGYRHGSGGQALSRKCRRPTEPSTIQKPANRPATDMP